MYDMLKQYSTNFHIGFQAMIDYNNNNSNNNNNNNNNNNSFYTRISQSLNAFTR